MASKYEKAVILNRPLFKILLANVDLYMAMDRPEFRLKLKNTPVNFYVYNPSSLTPIFAKTWLWGHEFMAEVLQASLFTITIPDTGYHWTTTYRDLRLGRRGFSPEDRDTLAKVLLLGEELPHPPEETFFEEHRGRLIAAEAGFALIRKTTLG